MDNIFCLLNKGLFKNELAPLCMFMGSLGGKKGTCQTLNFVMEAIF